MVASAVLFRDLGARSLLGDEAIYAEVAHEAAAGAIVPLRFVHRVFPHKPPLAIWATAAMFRALGEGEWSARCLDALLGVGTVLLLYFVGRRLFGRLAGWVAGLLLLSARDLVLLHGLRDCAQESPLVFLLTAALGLYVVWRLPPGAPEGGAPLHRRQVAVVGLLLGAALMVKSPVPLLGLGVVLPWELWLAPPGERWRRLLPPAAGFAVAVLVYLPWPLVLLASLGRGYFDFLRGDLVERAGGTLVASHVRSGVYGSVLLHDFGPWLVLAPLALGLALEAWRRSRREAQAVAYLLLWAAVILGFFAAIPSKNEWYIYPAYPALALAIAFAVQDLSRRLGRRSGWLRGAFLALCLAGLAAGVSRTWREAGAPVDRIEADRIARYVRSLGRPVVCRDEHLELREWNWYYLAPLWSRYTPPPPARECNFVLTSEPERYVPAAELGRRARYVRKYGLGETDVALVSLRGDLPPELLSFSERQPAARWGVVTLAGTRASDGPELLSRRWTAAEALGGPSSTAPALGYPEAGAVLRYSIRRPPFLALPRSSFQDAWVPGAEDVVMAATGVGPGELEITVESWPGTLGRPQPLELATRSGRLLRSELPAGRIVRLVVPLAEEDLRRGHDALSGWAPMRIWADGWTPRRALAGSQDIRHLGVRLLRLSQAGRTLWRSPAAPPSGSIPLVYWK